ncbi:tRNA lysidine(34) synthetase TilS [Bacteroides propionicifaciens]|uniref:tRNA lysidine(34) synthetase TilS n=1 Tax=Bacteroides propionicifaciens TaxID=392838 RepID=UPI000365C147|nr:tRNA lysidine(34) synthetase TilS [Bacteroides propionicifaciens]
MIKSTIAEYIKQENLANTNETLIVGLSGGADSVALLLVLNELGYKCAAAHCNFHLRGEESNRDQKFAEELCHNYHIPIYIEHFDTTEYAVQNRISIEMAARDLRYSWFDKLVVEGKGDKIAIAHHRDDNIETLILNLARGTGLKGLTGIQPINGHIIRPILSISRQEVETYLKDKNQPYVTDSTNLEDEFARNKVRLNIIPALEQINTACQKNIQNTITYLNQVQLVYKKAIEEATSRVLKNNQIDIRLLFGEVSPQTLLYEICYPLGFNSAQIEDLFNTLESTESKIFFSEGYKILRNRGKLHIEPLKEVDTLEQRLPQISINYQDIDTQFQIPRDKNLACFDADLIDKDNLEFNKWQDGDYFVPYGMKGRKNISDFFIDNKYSAAQKESQWLLKHNSDIIWVVGKRIDNRFCITKATKRAIIIRILN